MDMFKEYGMTKEELLSYISEASKDSNKYGELTEDGYFGDLADRLEEALGIIEELAKDYRK